MSRIPHYFCEISAQDIKSRGNNEETSDKPKSRHILQNNWPVDFKSVKTMKVKEIREELSQFGRD